ncbi:MAG: SusD/RagB family nutrient-binding outer membrane lipoprotein [Cyclobacteriaceae bacterium]|nr:SusD/RagB family nutrient-binding outer membrane lipoprotein [Cyclobacteriaceae bacterium]
MKKIIKLFVLIGVFLFSACETEDYLESPNDVTLSSADPNFILNRIQIDFAGFFNGTSSRGGRVTRMFHQASDTYEISHQAVNQNGTWSNAYANMLVDIKALKEIAQERGFRRHLGIAKTLEAYILMTLVDQFGDVPYSEALDPNNFNPKQDTGAEVYAAALALLNSAEEDFGASSIGAPNDYFYGGNYTNWVRLVNTLKLRYHLNRRLIDQAGSTTAIQALVTANNFITSDFVFRYGTNQTDPDSRHPFFAGQFPNGGGAYQSTFYMWHLTEAKKTGASVPGDGTASPDPRAHYYFYRQRGVNPTLESEVRCIGEFKPAHYPVDMAWCLPGTRGYWGRDHLDPQGIPPDNLGRTLYGLYPGGASFDNNTPGPMGAAKVGNRGAGIQPIMLTAYVDFMLAEVALTLGIGNAGALLTSGMEKHIGFVRTWSLTTLESATILAFSSNADHAAKTTSYVNQVNAEYAAAANDVARMRIIAREYWIALFGNGNEAYNLYRRTGQPDNMQPGQIPSFGKFPRTFFYPNDHVVQNNKANQKPDHDVRVFWDNNPPGFIN